MPTFLLLLFFYVAGTFERESGKVIDGQLIKQIIELYGRKEAQTLSVCLKAPVSDKLIATQRVSAATSSSAAESHVVTCHLSTLFFIYCFSQHSPPLPSSVSL